MTDEKVLEFRKRTTLPSIDLLSYRYGLMEYAIRTKLLESFLFISQEVLPVVLELERLLDETQTDKSFSSDYLKSFSVNRSLQELTLDIERLMLCYHKIIVGRDRVDK